MLKVFGLNGSRGFASEVARFLSIPLSPTVEKEFDDKESYARADENVRGSDVYVVSSLYGDDEKTAGEKLTALAFFCGSLRDASAGRVTVVAPYLAYARQDRKTESRAPIGTKYVATILEAMGVDRLLTMDVHNLAAFQNAFRIPTDNLEVRNLACDHIAKKGDFSKPLVCLSPDTGGMGRTRHFRAGLEKRLGLHNQIDIAQFDKARDGTTGALSGDKIIGDVKGKEVIIIDDLISTGGTIAKASRAVESHGGSVYAVVATHGLFIKDAPEVLKSIPRLIVADTVPPFRLIKGQKDPEHYERVLNVVETAELFAKAIRRNHDGASISELLEH